MIKRNFIILAITAVLIISSDATAAFVLSGTRFIYDEEKKSIGFDVTNQSKSTYGGQVWITNGDDGIKKDIYMIPTPSFFKVAGSEKQVIRVMKIGSGLPLDRETLFKLNVQEIPQKQQLDGNFLAIAMNTQVKLIYRPKKIKDGRSNAENLISLKLCNGIPCLKNPTPYYFAITKLSVNGKAVIFKDKEVMASLNQFAPFSEVILKDASASPFSGVFSLTAINDWGGDQVYNYPVK